jgi:hypothetical protein
VFSLCFMTWLDTRATVRCGTGWSPWLRNILH